MAIDVERARRDTPGCERVVHLNNAGSALPPQPVLDTTIAHMRREAEIGGYEAADEVAERMDAVYDSVAALLGCGSDEVSLVDNATRGWDLVFYGLDLQPGDRVLTTSTEYGSNAIAQLHRGVELVVAPDVAAMAELVDERVKLISLVHVPTQSGVVNPAAEVGALATDAGIPYLLDACQSVGQLPVDVGEIGCDFLAASGRKFLRAPRGTGFLYVRRSAHALVDPPMLDMRGATWTAPDGYEVRADGRRFEVWERPHALQLGLGAAIDYALDIGIDAIEARVGELAAELRRRLAALPGVTVQDRGERLCGLVTFTVDGYSPEHIAAALRANAVNVSVSEATSAQLDLGARGLDSVVRASVHYYNTTDELEVEQWQRYWRT